MFAKSPINGAIATNKTAKTNMCGMSCGTPSSIAWPILSHGIDASITVTDEESTIAQLTFKKAGAHIGPCISATLAASRKLRCEGWDQVQISHDDVVVKLATEVPR